MPWSISCNKLVTFAGRNSILKRLFFHFNRSTEGWVDVLSVRTNTFWYFFTSRINASSNHSENKAAVIHTFGWFLYMIGSFLKFLKALGFFDFPIKSNGSRWLPVELAQVSTVMHAFFTNFVTRSTSFSFWSQSFTEQCFPIKSRFIGIVHEFRIIVFSYDFKFNNELISCIVICRKFFSTQI